MGGSYGLSFIEAKISAGGSASVNGNIISFDSAVGEYAVVRINTDAPTPTEDPTAFPTASPTESHSAYPTLSPTLSPTDTLVPTESPTFSPTESRCRSHSDCDDNDVCTKDICIFRRGVCKNKPIRKCCTIAKDCKKIKRKKAFCKNNKCKYKNQKKK